MRIPGLFQKTNPVLYFSVRATDMIAVLTGALLAYGWKFSEWPPEPKYQIALLFTALLVPLMFPRFGVYKGWRGENVFQNFHNLIAAWIGVLLVLIVLAFLTKTSELYSREWLIVWAVLSLPVLFVFRLLLYAFMAKVKQRSHASIGVIIVGAGNMGREIVKRFRAMDWTGFEIVAFFDDKTELKGTELDGIPVRGAISDLAAYLRGCNGDRSYEVWLALPLRAEDKVKEILHDLRHIPVAIRFIPNIFGFRLLNHDVSQIAGIPIIDLNVTPMVGLNRAVKALEDRVLASIILLLISPLMLLLALGVKLSSPGPVFYRQERVGWNGVPFEMLKFRSMPVDAEAQTGPVWARQGEQRATRFGAFLRRTSLDELPQFINVLKGDMSVVGPRPERPFFVEKFKDEIPDYMTKHVVKAGITGWAQINGWRGETDLEKRIEFDLYYIEHWSVWFDLQIIFLTLFKGFVNKNAY